MATESNRFSRRGPVSEVAAAARSLAGSADWVSALLLFAAIVAAVVSGTAALSGAL